MDENRRERTCDVTSKPIINDCSVRIIFGHPSDRDGDTYYLSVHDDIGKNILDYISTLFTNGSNIEECYIKPRGTWSKGELNQTCEPGVIDTKIIYLSELLKCTK